MCFCLLLLLALNSLFIVSFGYHSIVNKLQKYVEANSTFAMQLNKTFEEANGPGKTNVTYNDMYQFFDHWITKAPQVIDNDFSYILTKFGQNTETGSIIFSSRIGQIWFQEYMNHVKHYCDSINSTNVIPEWEARPDMNMTEYIIPTNGFQSYNDFFAREIKPECRPIDSLNNDSIITSPCDGYVAQIDTNLTLNKNYTIKGLNYSLSTMLMNDYYAKQFIGGTIIQIFLQDPDYHRFHCSVSGYVAQIDQIGGFQYWLPVNETHHGFGDGYYRWLANNCRRGILYIDTGKFGLVAHNYVGVWLVNSVNIHIDAGVHLNKGDETGFYQYGGSTVALLFQRNALKEILVVQKRPVQYIKFGQAIAIANLDFYNNKKEL